MRNLVGSVKRGASSRFARDAVFLQIAAFVNLGTGLFTSWVLFRVLGVFGYGRYVEALNLRDLLLFLGNVGFAQLVVARASEAMGRLDEAGVARWIAFFVKAFGAFSAILCLLGFVLGPLLGVLILSDAETGLWAAVLGLSGPLTVPFYAAQCALQSTRRMRLLAEMENLKEITRAHLIICATIATVDLRGAVLAEVVGNLASAIFAFHVYAKARRDPGMALPSVRQILAATHTIGWGEVLQHARKGAVLSINKNFQALIPTVLPRLILGHFASPREVGYLTLAQNLMKLPLIGLQGVSRTLMPTLGQLRGAGQIDRLRSFLRKMMLISGGIVSLGSAAWWLFLTWFMPLFYGDASRPALPLLPWLWIAMAIAGFAVGVEAFFIVLDRLHIAIRISLIFVALSVVPGLWMIDRYHADGAAAYIALVHGSAATSIAYVLWFLYRSGASAPDAAPQEPIDLPPER